MELKSDVPPTKPSVADCYDIGSPLSESVIEGDVISILSFFFWKDQLTHAKKRKLTYICQRCEQRSNGKTNSDGL